MRILRIKQAEAALADGRLDEACDLLADVETRSHHRAQQLVGQLVRRLIERGEGHLSAGNLQQALGDCVKAAGLGGNLSEAAELRGRIARALSHKQQARRRHGDRVATAREHLDDGRLSVAEELLADAGEDSARVDLLRHEAALRRSAAEAALRRAQAALDRADYTAAVDELLTARANRAENDETADLRARVTAGAVGRARAELVRGRADLAGSLLRRLQPLGRPGQEAEDLLRVIEHCGRAWSQVGRGELRRAGEVLRRAQGMLPEAEWLRSAVDAADGAAAALESLRAGPLGMLSPAEGGLAETLPAGQPSVAPSRPVEPRAPEPPVLPPWGGEAAEGAAGASGSLVPRRFVLRVDGAGSSMVVRDHRVTIGPISSSQRPDLGLLADPSLAVITIERAEGDYFLRSAGPVAVNGKPTTGRLLADGDKIALSPRCRLRFRLPNAASGTAVLELSTARLPQADIRRVILLDRELLMGPDGAAHVRAEQLPGRAVLHVREGRLLCRTDAEVTIDREPADASAGLPVDRPVRIGPVGLVINRT